MFTKVLIETLEYDKEVNRFFILNQEENTFIEFDRFSSDALMDLLFSLDDGDVDIFQLEFLSELDFVEFASQIRRTRLFQIKYHDHSPRSFDVQFDEETQVIFIDAVDSKSFIK